MRGLWLPPPPLSACKRSCPLAGVRHSPGLGQSIGQGPWLGGTVTELKDFLSEGEQKTLSPGTMRLSSAVNPTWFAYRLRKCVRFYHKNRWREFKGGGDGWRGDGREKKCVKQMCATPKTASFVRPGISGDKSPKYRKRMMPLLFSDAAFLLTMELGA